MVQRWGATKLLPVSPNMHRDVTVNGCYRER